MNHFKYEIHSLNSLGFSGKSNTCIPERKSKSLSLHLQRCAGLAALACKCQDAGESHPLPLSTQGTWDTNGQILNFICFGYFHVRSEITQVCNGDFTFELQVSHIFIYILLPGPNMS